MPKHLLSLVGGMLAIGLLGAAYLARPAAQGAQAQGTANGQWRYAGGDAGSTRYSPLDQVTPANFETLKEAWRFNPQDVVGPMTARATPSYVGGKLLSVAGPRRHVVSMDPTNGKLLWNFVEPETYRSKSSMPRPTVRASRTTKSTVAASSTSPRRASFSTRWTRKPGSPSRTGDGRSPFPRSPRPASSISSRT